MTQQEHTILSHLPPDFQFDSDILWDNLVNLFKTSFQNRDNFGLQKSLDQIKCYMTTLRYYFNKDADKKEGCDTKIKELYSKLIGPLFDFITTVPFINFNMQAYAARLFSNLIIRVQSRPDLHLSLEKALTLHKELFFQPHRLLKKSLPQKECVDFLLFLSSVHHFFDESDADMLLEKYLDKIGCFESVSLMATLTLLRFYPTNEKCFEKFIQHLVPLLKNPISDETTCAIFHYLDKTLSSHSFSSKFDWKPHLRTIFNLISNAFNPTIQILNDEYNLSEIDHFDFSIGISGGFDKASIPTYSSTFISTLLVDDETDANNSLPSAILTILADFVNAFIPMITPQSNKAQGAVDFVSNLIKKFASIVKNGKKKVDEQTRSKFVKIVLPFVESSLFNAPQQIQDSMLKNVSKLALLSNDLTINGIVPFCLQNLVDPEMSSTSKICFRIIKNLIPSMLNEKHIEENLGKIPQIIDACLERCKSSLIDNYYLGMSLLSDIAQYISIPADKDMNSKLSMKQRMVATSMINTLKVVIDCHFSHNKAIVSDDSCNQFNNVNGVSMKDKSDSKSNLNKRFDCYFTAFDDSYIESIVIPSVLKYLKNASHATVLNSFTNRFIDYLTNVKPDLVSKSLTPKLEELFVNSNTTKKAFWAHSLASSFASCPSFEANLTHYIELVNQLLKSAEKEDKDEKEAEIDLESAYVLIHKLLAKVTKPNIIDWCNTEDGNVKWGANYKPVDVYPKWHQIEQSKINSMASSIFNAVQPHLNKFPSYSLKKQKIISKILSSFFALLDLRGKFGRIDFNDFSDNEQFANIEKSIFEFINKMIPSLQSYQSKEEILVLLSVAIIHHAKLMTNTMTIVQNITKKKKTNSSRFYCLLGFLYESSLTLHNYSYEITPRFEVLFNNVFNSMESEFESISHQSFFILNKLAHQSKKIHEEFVLKEIEVLENENHNEYQLKAAILFLMQNNMYYIMNNTELIARFFKALVSLKFEKDWKIHNYLNSLFDSIESYRQIIHISDCKAWRNLNNEILKIPRKIDSRHFYSIVRFIVFQDPAPSIEIVQFIINSLKSSSDANRLLTLHSLSNLLCRMKPITPRANFASVEEFKANEEGILPYVDKMTTGYHCKPHHYVFYTGSAVYNNDDENVKKYEEIRKFLVEKVFVNDRIFTSLFESFTLLHPKEESPTFNSHIYGLWKGIGQITRTSIVKHTKKLILRLLDQRSISMTSPVILTSLCELIAGISRSTKHWKKEEKDFAINELLIQACTPLVRFKGNDSSNISVQVMASTIVGDWDFRRVQWLYDIVKKCLSEIECNKEQMNEVALRSAMNFGNIIYMNANEFFNNEYIKIMKEIVIPLFSDMKKFKLDDISYLANFLVCRLSLTKQFHPNDKKNQQNYYGCPSFKTSTELASLPFVEVFDKNKNESPDLVALFLSEIFSGKMRDYSFFLPLVVDRFNDIINIDGKLVNITSGKFLHYGKNILCKSGFLRWENYETETFEVLFENVIKNKILPVRENLPWSTRLDIVGFLHALTFAHFFIFTEKEFMILIEDVLPPFLADGNQEVRKAARELLKMLVCITYSDSKDKWAEKVHGFFELANKEKGKLNKNLFVAVSFACALLANTTIWFTECPEWIPDVLNSLERTYAQGNCKEEIKAAMTDFFTRHEGREIPEIEEYKYAFTDRYFT